MDDSIKLLVTGIGRNSYAILESGIISVHEIQRVHRIPFAPPTFSGISSIDGKMTRILDLQACLGHKPLSEKGEGQALVPSSARGKDAFLVRGGLARLEVRAESLLPMPHHLATPVMEHCVLYSQRLMPVVNIENLYKDLLQGQLAPPTLSLPETFKKDRSSSGLAGKGMMILKIGGETFAVPDSLAAHKAIRLPRLVEMPLAPPYAPGIVHRKGKVWTVLDPSVRLSIHQESDRRLFLPLEGESFGLLINGSRGRLKAKEYNVQPLPPPFKSDILNSTVVSKDEVIPFLETKFLPTDKTVEFAKVKYKTASKVRSHFKRKPVSVLIFELAGQRYGVPASQVETETAALPFRPLPSSRPIAVGVTQKETKVLPVLDLARCFGEKSPGGPGWRMIQLKNGNFRGLLLAERTLGEISLPPGDHIALPPGLASMFVIGCFMQDEAVRLILDIEALVTHFKHDVTADPFRYLTMREWKEEDLFHAGLTVKTDSPLSTDTIPPKESPVADKDRLSPVGAHPATVADGKDLDEIILCKPPVTESSERTQPSLEAGLDLPQKEHRSPETLERTARDETETPEPSGFSEEPERLEKPIRSEKDAADKNFPRTQLLTTDSGKERTRPQHGDGSLDLSDKEDLVEEGLCELEKPGEPGKSGKPIVSVDDTPFRLMQPENEEVLERSFDDVDDAAARAPESPLRDKKSGKLLDGGLISVGSEQVHIPPFKQATSRVPSSKSIEPESSKADKAVKQSGRRKSQAGWLALLAFFLLFVGGYFFAFPLYHGPAKQYTADKGQIVVVKPSDMVDEKRSGVDEIRENSSGRVEHVVEDIVEPGIEPKMAMADDTPQLPSHPLNVSLPSQPPNYSQTSDHTRVDYPTNFAAAEDTFNEKGMATDMPTVKTSGIGSTPSRKTPPSLIMELRSSKTIVSLESISEIPYGVKPPAGSTIHMVVKGDTLWHIAQQFTGNPFNYPSLARASGINNPDLIFPGQKIAILITRVDDTVGP